MAINRFIVRAIDRQFGSVGQAALPTSRWSKHPRNPENVTMYGIVRTLIKRHSYDDQKWLYRQKNNFCRFAALMSGQCWNICLSGPRKPTQLCNRSEVQCYLPTIEFTLVIEFLLACCSIVLLQFFYSLRLASSNIWNHCNQREIRKNNSCW